MTKLIKRHPRKSLTAGIFLVSAALMTMAYSFGHAEDQSIREVVIVAKDIKFFADGQFDTWNPDITLKKGEPVRLIIRNEEPGSILHCFAISGLGVKTSMDLGFNESEELLLTPRKKGKFPYTCMLHPTMTGKVIVE